MSYSDYISQVPVRTFEEYQKQYISKILQGESGILSARRPDYLGLSSGTTGGKKLLPLYRDQVQEVVNLTSRNFFKFLWNEKTIQPMTGKLLYLSNTTSLQESHGFKTAYLSGLAHHHVPRLLQKFRLPSMKVNSIPSYRDRLEFLIDEIAKSRITYLGGTPPWLMDLIQSCESKLGKTAREIFPALRCIGTGGAALAPYRSRFENYFPDRKLIFFENYVATEGYLGFRQNSDSLSFTLEENQSTFFEFLPMSEYGRPNASLKRVCLEQVETGVEYAVIISNLSGLFSYMIGDTIRFEQLRPYTFTITGRTGLYLDRFGEHLVLSQVEKAFETLQKNRPGIAGEFCLTPSESNRYLLSVEADTELTETDLKIFDEALQIENVMYKNARVSGIVDVPLLKTIKPGTFQAYWIKQGRDPGQSKIPHIINDETFVRKLYL